MMYKEFNKTFDPITEDAFIDSILWFNGIKNKDDYAKLTLSSFPFEFKKTSAFIEKINAYKNKKVVVLGDYDCDGVCATSIMMKFLHLINIDCSFVIPNRFQDGYGINNHLIDEIKKKGRNLIITVDNGIKAKMVVEYAASLGIEVIITDHHQVEALEVPNTLVFDPFYNENFSFPNICGAFVAFVLVYSYLKREKIAYSKDFMMELYELSALATIGDVMPLRDVNRKIVSLLVKQINQSLVVNPGISRAIKTLSLKQVSSNDIAFKIVPVINAPGRLGDASLAVELLLNGENLDACLSLNESRKQLTKEYSPLLHTKPQNKVNVCFIPDLNEGIIGILAGNLKEKTKKPSFVFTNKDEEIKGSGRSIFGYNILEETMKVLTPSLCLKYGGHEGAMGLSLNGMDALKEFEEKINASYPSSITEEEEFYLDFKDISFEEAYKKLCSLEPFGEGFKIPLFHMEGEATNLKNPKELHTSFSIKKMGRFYNFFCFNQVMVPKKDVFFEINKSDFNGTSYYKGIIR